MTERRLVPSDSPVHVRRGKKVALMPLSAVHQWLTKGPFDAAADVFPEEYRDYALKRREPVRAADFSDFSDFSDCRPDEPLPCQTYHCDGTCEICDDARLDSQEHMDYLRGLSLIRLGIKLPEPDLPSPPQPFNDDDFGPDDIPF